MLLCAAQSGNVKLVSYIITQLQADILSTNITFCHFNRISFPFFGKIKFHNLLYLWNSKPNIFPYMNILHVACEFENLNLVQYLLSLKKIDPALVAIRIFEYSSHFYFHFQKITFLRFIFIKLHRITFYMNILHFACRIGNIEIVKLIISSKILDIKDVDV